MRKLNAAVDRFCYRHPNFGIPDLMKYIVIGNVIVYLLSTFFPAGSSTLAFNLEQVFHGQVWRLLTFIFVSGFSGLRDAIWLALFLYFYYFIGTTLEREWGAAKFTLYYVSGTLLTLLTSILVTLVSGGSPYLYGTSYVNLSMFFAFAMLYPDMQVLLMFIFPVKVKWIAWVDAAFFAYTVISSLFSLNWLSAALPIIALLNFFVFFWPELSGLLERGRGRVRRQTSPKTIQFKKAAQRQAQQAKEQGYRHKCCVCGRTDADYPNLQFRYCSKCTGYHCFCEDHIFNHVHFTD